MKNAISLIVLLIGFSTVYSQKDYRPECRKLNLPLNGLSESFEVSVYSDLYGARFADNRCLTPELEKKIRDYLSTPYRSDKYGSGRFTLTIVKRSGEYYLYREDSNPLLKKL